MSTRPWLMRALPARLRERAVYRLYLQSAVRSPQLFQLAPLHFAPGAVMDLAPTDVGHAIIAYAGYFEYALSARIAALAQRGGLLVDVGANYGYYALLWAAGNAGNRVLALEASPRNVAPLTRNVTLNRMADRVTIRALAAGRETGTVSLDLGPPEQTGWGGIAAAKTAHTVDVPSVRLDDLAQREGIEHIDVLKVDVEGADAWVLEGAGRLLRERRIRDVFFERNDPRMAALGVSFHQIQTLLGEAGYRTRRIATNEWHAWCPS